MHQHIPLKHLQQNNNFIQILYLTLNLGQDIQLRTIFFKFINILQCSIAYVQSQI